MKIGFYMKWPKGMAATRWNVIGEELYAEAMCKYINRTDNHSGELFAPNYLPGEKQDVMIYLNDTPPIRMLAKKHILYLQNVWEEGSDKKLKRAYDFNYDGYMFTSDTLCKLHGENGLYLPLGADTGTFSPTYREPKYNYEVSYVGNDIKGEEATIRYLCPATKFNLGLFGNWPNPDPGWKFWKWGNRIPEYQHALYILSRGKISQLDVPFLYSNSKINLNFTHQDYINWNTITLRTFEVLACKGFLITDRVPLAEKTMQGCMVFTDGGHDLIEKIKYYLKYPGERSAIAEKGYEYVIRNATLKLRTEEMVKYLQTIVGTK